MTRKDVATMATGEWLNDEMVNFTIGTMAEGEMARCGGTQPRVHFFNTFFVGKLTAQGDGYDYNAVR
jgi:sentrin-specific protease 1